MEIVTVRVQPEDADRVYRSVGKRLLSAEITEENAFEVVQKLIREGMAEFQNVELPTPLDATQKPAPVLPAATKNKARS